MRLPRAPERNCVSRAAVSSTTSACRTRAELPWFVIAMVFAPEACARRRNSTVSAVSPECEIDDIAAAVAESVHIPDEWGCCAYAGDRGLLHPELTASATAREAAEVVSEQYDLHLSANRTCELGMTEATGRPYRHVLEALEEATRARG